MPQDNLIIVFLQRGNDPYTNERIKFFQSKKHLVFSISFYPEKQANKIEGVIYYSLRKIIFYKIPLFKRFSHYFEIKKILKSIKPDIFHVVSALNLFYCNYNLSFKKIVQNQGSDLILSPQKYKFLIPFYKKYFTKVDGIIQDSKLLFEKSIQYGGIDNSEKNQIIEIGIDFSIFNPDIERNIIRNRYNLNNRLILLHTRGNGSLYNLDIILCSLKSLAKEFPDIVLILTTSFKDINLKCRKFIKSQDLSGNIIFAGFQNRIQDLKYFYIDADLVISVPSSDSSPFSVYESIACKTPVIVSDLPWFNSKFLPGKHLIVVPPRDSIELTKKISEFFTNTLDSIIDIESAYQHVYENINFQIENTKLENL